jgi:hypothetical protein
LTSAAGRFIQVALSDLVLAVSPTPEPAIKGFWVFLRLKNRRALGGKVKPEEDRRNMKYGKTRPEQVHQAAKGARAHTKGERENGQTATTEERRHYEGK